MSRKSETSPINTPTARGRLKARKQPYWQPLQRGHALGYRKGSKGGVWLCKIVVDGLRKEHKIGLSDDQVDGKSLDADGTSVFSYAQAQRAAWEWFDRIKHPDKRIDIGKFTVSDAMDEYLVEYEKEGKAVRNTKYVIETHIRPALGDIMVKDLTRRKVSKWHGAIANQPARLRTRRGKEQRFKEVPDDPDARRRRQSTANRVLTVLKAALNFVAREYALDDTAWKNVKPFKNVDAAKVRWLDDDETRRLVNASQEPLRSLVVAALMTGARYGELARMRVRDFDNANGSVFVGESKSGKSRHIVLTDEGRRHFEQATMGKSKGDLLFARTKAGAAWGKSHQTRPLTEACTRAKISPAIGFHTLRHTYASRLVREGAPLIVVADQLGHEDTRMCEKHYAHLNNEFISKTVRAAFSELGLVSESNVESLAR